MNGLSMFTITGQVLNTFEAPGRKANEKAGIEAQDAKPKVQILGEMPVPGEQTRMELVTLTCEDQREYEGLRGQIVAVPLGIFAPARGQIIYYIPKGAKPTLVRPNPVQVQPESQDKPTAEAGQSIKAPWQK